MSSTTVRPDSVVSSANLADASTYTKVTDDSDSTYTSTASLGARVRYTLANPSIAAGSVVKTLTGRVRCARVSTTTTPAVTVRLYDHNGTVAASGASPITWDSPSTVSPLVTNTSAYTPTNLNSFDIEWEYTAPYTGYQFRVHEVYCDVVYVTKPVTSASAPTGTITTTNLPQVVWSNTLDPDGGAQTAYEVKYFTAAQYGIGGFNPSSSPYTLTSGVVASSATSYTPTTPLADATYRAYVRVAQTVNGVYHWSDWQYSGFTLTVALPGVPTISLYPDLTDAVMHISVTSQSGSATTDALEIQRSTDNVTWEPVRLTTDTAGVVTALSAYVYDFEGGNSQACWYRARALHNYSGVWAASAWATAGPRSWQSPGVWWLKSVQNPALNMPVTVHSQQEISRPARQGRFQPLGARRAIVVSDTQGPAQGTITFRCDTDAQAAALDLLLADQGVLLLQGAPGDHWTDRYVKFGDLQRQRTSDKSYVEPTVNTLSWIEVDPPAGPITAWRVVGS